ncbi:hypothetical protein AX15_005208 [Amanita polypyramis BW_CC]|nr:hypothetical protein AX15_005208 [Amanita polypyramis BW_CC]
MPTLLLSLFVFACFSILEFGHLDEKSPVTLDGPQMDPDLESNPSPSDDGLFSFPRTFEDDLISVLFGDIQPSIYDCITSDILLAYNLEGNAFNGELREDEFNASSLEMKEENSTVKPEAGGIEPENAIHNGRLKIKEGKTSCEAELVAQVGDGAILLERQAPYPGKYRTVISSTNRIVSDDFTSPLVRTETPQITLSKEVERVNRAVAGTLENTRSTSLSPYGGEAKSFKTSEVSLCLGVGEAYNKHNAAEEQGSESMRRRNIRTEVSSKSTDEACLVPANKRQTKVKAKYKDRLNGSTEEAGNGDQGSHGPHGYHLRPVRGRPLGSRNGGRQKRADISSNASCVPQFNPSILEAVGDGVPSRSKRRKVIKPNPYPDLSRYTPDTKTGKINPETDPTSTTGVDLVTNGTILPQTLLPTTSTKDPVSSAPSGEPTPPITEKQKKKRRRSKNAMSNPYPNLSKCISDPNMGNDSSKTDLISTNGAGYVVVATHLPRTGLETTTARQHPSVVPDGPTSTNVKEAAVPPEQHPAEKPRKTREKTRKSNPYPDLSKYVSKTWIGDLRTRPAAATGLDSAFHAIPLLPSSSQGSTGSQSSLISDDLILRRASWDDDDSLSPASESQAETDMDVAGFAVNKSTATCGESGARVTNEPVMNPIPAPLCIASRKRKQEMEWEEEYEIKAAPKRVVVYAEERQRSSQFKFPTATVPPTSIQGNCDADSPPRADSYFVSPSC